MRYVRAMGVAAAGAVCAAAGGAHGELITFTFSDLSASFVNGATMQDRVFAANAAAAGGIQTAGDVSRVDLDPALDALFNGGFAGLSMADVSVAMNVDTAVIAGDGVSTLAATGMFTITDADGDTITGQITGNWTDLGAGFDAFQGLIFDAAITPAGGGDNLNFNGPSGGSFPFAGLPMSNLDGAFVQLQLTSGTFFNADFANVSSQASGVLVPAPAAIAVLGLGGVAAARRRRR